MKASLTTREFRRSLAPVRKLTQAQWIKRLNKMHPVKAGVAAGFIAWHRIFQGVVYEVEENGETKKYWKNVTKELKELWKIAKQAKQCSPEVYADCLREAGFPQDSCLVIKAVQEKLVIYAEQQNVERANRHRKGGSSASL